MVVRETLRLTAFARTSRQLQCTARRWSATIPISRRYANSTSTHVLPSRKVQRHLSCTATSQQSRKDISPPPSWNDSTRKAADSGFPASGHDDDSSEVYKPPTTGLVSRLPASWMPYAELVRLDKPTGTYYLFFPCLFSTLLAAPLANPIPPPLTVVTTSALFLAGALIMRGAGCTINDLWDRNLDPHVARTRLRPIARGAITVNQAIPFLGVQLLAGLGVLLQFPTQCLWYGIPSLLLVAIYPLAKRVTNYPQFVLGLTFSWGAIMGFPALEVDLLHNTPALISAVSFYASCVAWTVIYDMIYAFQDIRDDANAGIKSIARAHERDAKRFMLLVLLAQAIMHMGPVLAAAPEMPRGYYLLGALGAELTVLEMIRRVELNSTRSCAWWFKNGVWLFGGVMTVGLVADYWACYTGYYQRKLEERRIRITLKA